MESLVTGAGVDSAWNPAVCIVLYIKHTVHSIIFSFSRRVYVTKLNVVLRSTDFGHTDFDFATLCMSFCWFSLFTFTNLLSYHIPILFLTSLITMFIFTIVPSLYSTNPRSPEFCLSKKLLYWSMAQCTLCNVLSGSDRYSICTSTLLCRAAYPALRWCSLNFGRRISNLYLTSSTYPYSRRQTGK